MRAEAAVSSAAVVHRYFNVHARRLHVLEYAGRKTRSIVLIHGIGGTAWLWSEVAPELARIGTPVAVDLRGYGESQWSPTHSYSTADHVGDLASVIEEGDLGPVDLVGFSWGGLIGIDLAADRPDLVRSLAVLDVPPAPEGSETDIPAMQQEFDDLDAVTAELGALAPRARTETLERFALLSTSPVADGRLARKRDPYFLERWPWRSDDLRREFEGLRIPTLVVRASESHVLSRSMAEEMQRASAGVELVEIPETGHLLPLERPGELASTLAQFLEEL